MTAVAIQEEPGLQRFALYIAMVVRNALEDFHCAYLSDSQMAELNPIVRDAVYSALWAAKYADSREGANEFVSFSRQMIPSYWESPELCDDLKELLVRLG